GAVRPWDMNRKARRLDRVCGERLALRREPDEEAVRPVAAAAQRLAVDEKSVPGAGRPDVPTGGGRARPAEVAGREQAFPVKLPLAAELDDMPAKVVSGEVEYAQDGLRPPGRCRSGCRHSEDEQKESQQAAQD